MKLSFFLFYCPLLFILIFFFTGVTYTQAQHPTIDQGTHYPGTYTFATAEVTLTLSLKQAADNALTGTLESSTGAVFQLNGMVELDVATGTCSSEQGNVFFEAYREGTLLTLALIEPDYNNFPDYNTAQYFQFEKQSEDRSVSLESPVRESDIGQMSGISPGQDPVVQRGDVTIKPGEAGSPAWGFKFPVPAGWTHQQTSESILLGSHTIAGLIMILPHMSQNMQDMEQEMYQGLQEEGAFLALKGSLSKKADHILNGDYSGIVDGQTAKAKGLGTLSPYGGGAYIIAVSTPDGFSDQLVLAAETIGKSMIYFKQNVSDLMRHFVGTWTKFTSNTSTWITFHPDGTYSEQYESSYSGDFQDQLGNVTGNWGATGQESDRGRWTVQGNLDEGRIVVRYANGNEIVYNYRVNIENGRKFYNNYYMNGEFYFKK